MSRPTSTPVREQVKAILSGVITGLGTLATALADGAVTPLEWTFVALSAVTAYGTVYGVRQPTGLAYMSERDLLALAKRARTREAAQ